MTNTKPFSRACENNKAPIFDVLKNYFSDCSSVLEIGSGTGQHAVYMSKALPHLKWQPSDRPENIAGIKSWVNGDPALNLLDPIILDVEQLSWPLGFDAVFSANTAHIMSWEQAQVMIVQVASLLPKEGVFVLYGPFKYQGRFTSASNHQFDDWLKSVRSTQGIRDFEAVETLANVNGLFLLADISMPANNQVLVWQKK